MRGSGCALPGSCGARASPPAQAPSRQLAAAAMSAAIEREFDELDAQNRWQQLYLVSGGLAQPPPTPPRTWLAHAGAHRHSPPPPPPAGAEVVARGPPQGARAPPGPRRSGARGWGGHMRAGAVGSGGGGAGGRAWAWTRRYRGRPGGHGVRGSGAGVGRRAVVVRPDSGGPSVPGPPSPPHNFLEGAR